MEQNVNNLKVFATNYFESMFKIDINDLNKYFINARAGVPMLKQDDDRTGDQDYKGTYTRL